MIHAWQCLRDKTFVGYGSFYNNLIHAWRSLRDMTFVGYGNFYITKLGFTVLFEDIIGILISKLLKLWEKIKKENIFSFI